MQRRQSGTKKRVSADARDALQAKLGTESLSALVLAGGEGRRLRALTQMIAGAPIPKQYCRILGDRSLLETTLSRIGPLVPQERTFVVVNSGYLDLALTQLPELPTENILVQSENRDTGPGIVFGLRHLAARRPRASVAVFPSDHYVDDEPAFRAHVTRAARFLDRFPSKIVLLGIRATHAEPGYGYIEPSDPITMPDESHAAYHVRAFHEKPSVELAEDLQKRGGLWNSFVMLFRVNRLLALLRQTRRADVESLRKSSQSGIGYQGVSSWNFSTGFLSRVPQHLVVVPVEGLLWSDWGTPEAVERTLATLKIEPCWRRRPPKKEPAMPDDRSAACVGE